MAKKKQKQAASKPGDTKHNTLAEDKPNIIEWMQRLWRIIKRRVGDAVSKRIAPQQTAEDSSAMMTMPPPAGRDTAFRLSGVLVMCITLLIMIFGGILGARLYSVLGMGTNSIKNVPAIYIQGKHTLKFKGALIDDPVTITDTLMFDGTVGYSLDKNTVISQDSSQLLYLNNVFGGAGDLYQRNINRAKPSNKDGESSGRLIAAEVLQDSFCFAPNGKDILYMRASPNEGDTLLQWSNGKEQVFDRRIHSLLGIANDGYLYYTVNRESPITGSDMAGMYNLCRIGSDGTKQILAEGLNGQVIEFVAETGSVLFSLPAGIGKLGDTLITLSYWEAGQTQILAEKISNVVDFSKSGAVLSTAMTVEKSNPSQYFEDDMVMVDANLKEPDEKDFMVEKTGLWGRKSTELDKDAYEKAVSAYEAKLNRTNIRKAISAQERNVKRSTLYYSVGSSRTMVDNDIAQMVDADAAAGVAIYIKERIPAPQKFKLSQVVDPIDAIRLLNTVLISTVKDYYYVSAGREPVMFLSVTKSERVRAELDGNKGIYFIKEDINGAGAPLNYVPAQDAGLGVAKKLDDKVSSLTGLRYRDQLLYMREDNTDDSVTVCAASGQDRTRLVDGLPIYPLPVPYGDALLCYRDYNSGREIGTLTLYSGKGKIKPVARNAHSYSYRLPNYIYVIKDYDAAIKSGDLHLYTGNSEKLTLIDTDVSDIKSY